MVEFSAELRQLILSLADDEHLMGQRHSAWVGGGPFLEEDVTFAGIARDELGHAEALYTLLVCDGDGAVDRLAYRRPAAEYRSCWLVEYETNEWAETLVRHFYYDTVEQLRWRQLAGSSEPALAELAEHTIATESFHVRHANGLLDVLLASDESRRRIEFAATTLWPLALGLFDTVSDEHRLVDQGIVAEPLVEQVPSWRAMVRRRFSTVDWPSVDDGECANGQRHRTMRHPDFDRVHHQMQDVMEADPEAIG